MNLTNCVAEAARRAFDDLSLSLQKSAHDDNSIEELEECLKIMDKNEVNISNSVMKTKTVPSHLPPNKLL